MAIAGPAPDAAEHDISSRKPGLDKIDDWRFKPRRKGLTGDCGSDKRENSRANDGADADAGEIEAVERAFHLPVRRGRFGDQMIRTFSSEQLKCHRARSSHQAVRMVNPKLWYSGPARSYAESTRAK